MEPALVTTTSSLATTPRPGLLRDLVALTKPRVTSLVVFTMLSGVHLADGVLGPVRTLVALLGCVLLVGSANALNCFIERESDGFMSRTATRPLPAGRLSPEVALWLGAVLLVLSVPLLWWGANPLTTWLGLFAHALYVAVYTPLKRVTSLSTVLGFIPGAMPPLMGYTAVTGQVELPGVMLFLVLFTWQLPHTLAIGLFRGEEYTRAGIRVIPEAVGARAASLLVLLTTVLVLPVTLSFTALGVAGTAYGVVAGVAGLGFIRAALPGLTGTPGIPWARKVFFFSMGHLTLVMAALAVARALA